MAEFLAPQDTSVIPAMSAESRAVVQTVTDHSRALLPQIPFVTEHKLHAGVYTRTVLISAPPAGRSSVVTGVLIKIPTQLIICGDVFVYMGEDEKPLHVVGQRVLLGSAGRKQMFRSGAEYTMTMLFATQAKTVSEAEAEFTDEIEMLVPLSEADRHDIIVTGEAA